MDSRTNTIFGWVLFSSVVALGLGSISSRIYHGDRAVAPETPGYIIEAAEAEGAGADAGPSLATLLTTGSASAGESVFSRCLACHSIEQGGPSGIGPNLHGILGTPVAQRAGFSYSSALAGKGGNWDFESMDAWLKSPRAFANGTSMSFAGLSSAEDRANLILFMLANGGGPALPAAPAEAQAVADAGEAQAPAGAESGAEAGAEGAETAAAAQ